MEKHSPLPKQEQGGGSEEASAGEGHGRHVKKGRLPGFQQTDGDRVKQQSGSLLSSKPLICQPHISAVAPNGPLPHSALSPLSPLTRDLLLPKDITKYLLPHCLVPASANLGEHPLPHLLCSQPQRFMHCPSPSRPITLLCFSFSPLSLSPRFQHCLPNPSPTLFSLSFNLLPLCWCLCLTLRSSLA